MCLSCHARCALQGVEAAAMEATKAYAVHGALDKFELYVEPGVGHECTASALAKVEAWMDRHLLAPQCPT